MRTELTIKADIELLKQEIRYAQREEATDTEMELLYNDLEELQNELNDVRTLESSLWGVSPLQV